MKYAPSSSIRSDRRSVIYLCVFAAAFTLFLGMLAGTGMAAPEFNPDSPPGDCVLCHEGEKMVNPDHPNTAEMNWQDCAACHNADAGEAKTLSMRLPVSHIHMLAEQECSVCHEGGDTSNLPSVSACQSCHDDYAAKTPEKEDWANPHENHLGVPDCWICHKVHAPSVNYCILCHPTMEYTVP